MTPNAATIEHLFNFDTEKKPLELTEEEKKAVELEEENAELEKLAKSIWLTDKFVDYPITIILLGWGLICLFIVLCFLFSAYMPSPITNRDLLDYDDINTRMFDTREAATAEI